MSGLALQRLAEDRKSLRKRSSLARTSTKLCAVASVVEADGAPVSVLARHVPSRHCNVCMPCVGRGEVALPRAHAMRCA
eukprot:366551-Chlamydomonas_euryale.AAC.44